MSVHKPVLVAEAIALLTKDTSFDSQQMSNIPDSNTMAAPTSKTGKTIDSAADSGNVYADCTYGRGGHTRALLKVIGQHDSIYVFDKDPDAISDAFALAREDPRVIPLHESFANFEAAMRGANFLRAVDGVLFDLGVSSPQLDSADRGFSFQKNGPLDMRMNYEQGQSAREWLAQANDSEISHVLKTYGEERQAKKIARAIVEHRTHVGELTTTGQLAELVCRVSSQKFRPGHHPATRTFQAIRIFINDELMQLSMALKQVLNRLKPGGRLVVISFHSLEDRIAKQFISKYSKQINPSRHSPVPQQINESSSRLKKIGKALRPSIQECKHNPRARSAILRCAEVSLCA